MVMQTPPLQFAELLRTFNIKPGMLPKQNASVLVRKGLDDPSLWASSPALVLEALAAWPNDGDTLPSHEDFVRALAAIKAALGPTREEYYGAVEEWALGYGENSAKG